jgi:hypothetical protein
VRNREFRGRNLPRKIKQVLLFCEIELERREILCIIPAAMNQLTKRTTSITVRCNGATLKQLRRHLNLKQHEVEIQAGLPPGRLSRYERSDSAPIEHVRLLSRFFNCTNEDITDPSSIVEIETMMLKLLEFRQSTFKPFLTHGEQT